MKSAINKVICANVIHYEAVIKILFIREPDDGHLFQQRGSATFADIFTMSFH
jgi:hypothetical protein